MCHILIIIYLVYEFISLFSFFAILGIFIHPKILVAYAGVPAGICVTHMYYYIYGGS